MEDNTPGSTHYNYSDLARIRAEVVRALKEEPPNVMVLTSALDRVDALLDRAREELLSAVREVKSVPRLSDATSARRELLHWG